MDVYAAVTLGCPALREQHPGRLTLNPAEKMTHGLSNVIDHVLADIINEAYARNLFDISRYAERKRT